MALDIEVGFDRLLRLWPRCNVEVHVILLPERPSVRAVTMDRLGTCMDALRILARSNDPDRASLVEGHIDAYLTTETVSVWQALERLCQGIRDEQAEGRQGENWSLAKGYIRSVLHGLGRD
jgi:hypothetical protein